MTARPPRTLGVVTHAGGHPGPYELALNPDRSTVDTARRVAALAEAARIDALFVPDLLTFGAQGSIGAQEPLVHVAALSQVTSRIGLIATVSTTFHHPYNLARLFATLDHVSNGRAAWNVVTSSIGEENFGPGGLPGPEERYARAHEVLDVAAALWDSWRPGSLRAGPDGRAVLDVERIQPIKHQGVYFTVEGPLNIPPSPQGRPVLIQAGQSPSGVELGARHAEVVFTALSTLDAARQYTGRIRARAEALGRPGGLPLVFSSLHATFGATEAEARRLVRERHEAIDLEAGRALLADMLGGGVDLSEAKLDEPLPESLLPDPATVGRRRGRVEIFSGYARRGHRALVRGRHPGAGRRRGRGALPRGRARRVCGMPDERQHAFVVDGLLHELRRRGIAKRDYLGPTLRENLGLPALDRAAR